MPIGKKREGNKKKKKKGRGKRKSRENLKRK